MTSYRSLPNGLSLDFDDVVAPVEELHVEPVGAVEADFGASPDMARWNGTTKARGYGWDHVQERERRLARYRPGDPCAHGGEPLTWWPLTVARQYLDLPHNATRTGYLPGLSCRYHNRADGAARGNRQRRARASWRPSRQW